MPGKKKLITADALNQHRASLRKKISQALTQELADCAIPDLAKDPASGSLWSSLPTVDSKTAHKISASIIEQVLGCQFKPTWIRRGGYSSVEEATEHVISQLSTHCVESPATATA